MFKVLTHDYHGNTRLPFPADYKALKHKKVLSIFLHDEQEKKGSEQTMCPNGIYQAEEIDAIGKKKNII